MLVQIYYFHFLAMVKTLSATIVAKRHLTRTDVISGLCLRYVGNSVKIQFNKSQKPSHQYIKKIEIIKISKR